MPASWSSYVTPKELARSNHEGKGKCVSVVRLSIAASLAVLGVMGLPAAALADNWGSADWGDTVYGDGEPPGRFNCSTPSTHPNTYEQGECTANNDTHLVWIANSVYNNQPDLANALEVSIENDYDSVGGDSAPYAFLVTDPDAFADARVYYSFVDPNFDIAFTYCPDTASFGNNGYRYHRWCTPQYVIYQNNSDGNACWSNGACRKHYACHELGHTLGLQHPVGLYNPDTCMGYAASHPKVLRPHEKGHLINCYPHPNPPPHLWWHESRTTLCKD